MLYLSVSCQYQKIGKLAEREMRVRVRGQLMDEETNFNPFPVELSIAKNLINRGYRISASYRALLFIREVIVDESPNLRKLITTILMRIKLRTYLGLDMSPYFGKRKKHPRFGA